MVVWIFRR